ncbi:MAG: 4'-phosphopantetheinyl transferase superfamily protein [Pseudomonadota bacterium]
MTDLPALAQALRSAVGKMIGQEIGVGVADPAALAPPLPPEEDRATRRMVDKRRREFAAGRAAARAAMAELGLPPAAIPMGDDRAPCWPVGCLGSISHSAGAAVAIVTRQGGVRSLGLDIEADTDLDPRLWPEILTPSEADWIAQRPAPERGRLAKQVFSAKEAVYKAQYPLTGARFGFDAVSLRLDGAGGFLARMPPAATPLPKVAEGQLHVLQDLVVAVLALP